MYVILTLLPKVLLYFDLSVSKRGLNSKSAFNPKGLVAHREAVLVAVELYRPGYESWLGSTGHLTSRRFCFLVGQWG